MKNKITLTLLSLLSSSYLYALDLTASPFGSVTATVSSTEPNLIHVKNDRVTHLTAKAGAILDDEATTDGSVAFSTDESKPFSILIETEKGYSFTLNATPNKNSRAASIVIHNLEDKGNPLSDEVRASSAWYKTYSGVISHILTELINNRIPDGFVETRKRKFDAPSSVKGFFNVRNTTAWAGLDMRVVKLDITNISQSEIELNERYFWNKNVMAISFYPKVSSIRPNTRVFAYVVLKEGE